MPRWRSYSFPLLKYGLAVLLAVIPNYTGWLKSPDQLERVAAWAMLLACFVLIAIFVRREAFEHRTRSQSEYEAQALELNAQRISSVAGVLLRTLNVLEREVRDDNPRIATIAESGDKWNDEFRPHQIRIEQWRETAKLALQDEAPNTAIGDFVVMKYPKETERAYRYEIERFSLCRERLNDVILDPHRWAKENRARTRGGPQLNRRQG